MQKEKIKKQKLAAQKEKLVANSKKLRQLNKDICARIKHLSYCVNTIPAMDDWDAGERSAQRHELEFLLGLKKIYGE